MRSKEFNDQLYKRLMAIPPIPCPVTPEWLSLAVESGMVAKSDLVDGQYYQGTCRNAQVAVWRANEPKYRSEPGCFVYMRTKFSSVFPETINHPEDDNGFNLFIPVGIVEPLDSERITSTKPEHNSFCSKQLGPIEECPVCKIKEPSEDPD